MYYNFNTFKFFGVDIMKKKKILKEIFQKQNYYGNNYDDNGEMVK